jgi:LDH2 family malate/lactate/ureidoglycolate dehydrogenase
MLPIGDAKGADLVMMVEALIMVMKQDLFSPPREPHPISAIFYFATT